MGVSLHVMVGLVRFYGLEFGSETEHLWRWTAAGVEVFVAIVWVEGFCGFLL